MLKEFLTPNIQSNDIVLRGSGTGDSNFDFIRENAGFLFPIIRIGDMTIHQNQIKSFNLVSGNSFLPKLTITIDDIDRRIREYQLTQQLDTIGFYIGNNNDSLFIKSDYLIEKIISSSSSNTLTIIAEFYIDSLYTRAIRGIANTSFQAITQLCDEIGLGLVSNIDETNDSMNWIQPNITNIEFLKHLTSYSFLDSNDSMMSFVDHWGYLNFISTKKATDNRTPEQIDVDPISGVEYESPKDFILTNNALQTNSLKITRYNVQNYYGTKAKESSSSLIINQVSDENIDESTIEEIVSTKEQLTNQKNINVGFNDNVHINFGKAYEANRYNKYLLQNKELLVETEFFMSQFYPYMYVPVEIYNLAQRGEMSSMDSNINTDTMIKNQSNQINQSNTYTLNENLSGNYVISTLSLVYTNNTKLKNSLTLINTD